MGKPHIFEMYSNNKCDGQKQVTDYKRLTKGRHTHKYIVLWCKSKIYNNQMKKHCVNRWKP